MVRRLAIAVLLLVSATAGAGDWEYLGQRDGVETWGRRIDDSHLMGFRGRGIVDVHVSRLLAVILDSSKAADWVDLLAETRVLQAEADTEVLYQRFGLGWPVADRDYVLRRTLRLFPDRHSSTVQLASIDGFPVPAVAGVVRAEVSGSYFSFTALPGGRTAVECEAFTDPKGIVPDWVVNLIQRDWAHKSILALTRRAQQPDVVPFGPARDW